MSFNINIPCPHCKEASIMADTQQMLLGVHFSCPKCQASIGLTAESKETVGTAMTKLEELRSKNLSNK